MTVAQRTSAAALIEAKGQTVTIAGSTAGTYNTATATVSNTSYSKTAKAVVLPFSRFAKAGNAMIAEGDQQLLIAGLDTSGAALAQPPVNSIVTLADGTKRTLIAAEPLDPDGAGSILYDCIARGAKP